MKRITISLVLIFLSTFAFSQVAGAQEQEEARQIAGFGLNSVQQMTAVITDVNVAENFIIVDNGRTARKKILASGAVILQVTESGARIATLADLVKDQKVHMWVKRKRVSNKTFQGLIITQFLGAEALAGMPPFAQFTAGSSKGLENATPSIQVELSKVLTENVKISYTISGTATGGGIDYTLANGDLIIPAGKMTGIIPLIIANDSIREGDETVVVTLTSATEVTLGTQKIHTYTIQDDEQSEVGFEQTTSGGVESTTSINFPVILSAASTQEVRVNYTVSGTATGKGTDFTLVDGTAIIPAGQTGTNIIATITDDSAIESGETIIITLSEPVGAKLSANTTHTYTISDNDQPTVSFGSSSSAGAENIMSINIPVLLSAASKHDTSVNFTVSGTATGGDTDYTLTNGTLTIPAGQTTANVTLPVVNDTIDEIDETVIITLYGPINAILGETSVYTYTIQDNDNPTIQFSFTNGSGSEHTTPVSIGVELSAAPAAEVQVGYAVSGSATGGGKDYTLASGTFTIATGKLSTNLSLAIVDDTLQDPNETIVITLVNPINATLGSRIEYTYTINDND